MSSPLIPLGVTYMRNEYASIVIGLVTYGIYVVLAGICMYILLQHRKKSRGQYILIAYTCSMFITSTVYIGFGIRFSEIGLIETIFNPEALAGVSSKVSMGKNAAYIINIWLADSLMVYRTYVVWGGNPYVMIVPVIIFIGAVASSIVLLAEIAVPGASEAPGSLISDMGTAFLSLSVSSNIISTLLISGQLWRHRWALRRAGVEGSDLYTRISAIVAESAALYSGCGLIYIPLYSLNFSSQYGVSALYVSLGSIAPAVITIRMALGIATNNTRHSTVSAMKVAKMADDCQITEKRETSQIFAGLRSNQDTSAGTSTLYPMRQGSKSANTLEGGSDAYINDHSKRGEV